MQSFILIGGYVAMWATLIGGCVAMWATLIGDTSMAKLTMKCEMQEDASARVAVEVRDRTTAASIANVDCQAAYLSKHLRCLLCVHCS